MCWVRRAGTGAIGCEGATGSPSGAARPQPSNRSTSSTGAIRAQAATLAALGYEYRGEAGIPIREFFRMGEPRTYHLHLVAHGGMPLAGATLQEHSARRR